VRGTHFSGKTVTVTFDGVAATVLYGDDNSLNVQLPASLTPGVSQLQVAVDSDKSAPMQVTVSELAPAVFPNAIFNSDGPVHGSSNAAIVGSGIQIAATGLFSSVPGPLMVKLHDRQLTPVYAGMADGQIGVNQIDVIVPDDLPAMTTELSVCGFSAVNP